MQWDDLRPFLAVARDGSLSAAARRLRIDHATVGRRLDGLETALGVRLFDRLPRGWRLTAEGEALLPRAERVEAEALAFQREAAGSSGAAGVVRLSAPPAVGALFVTPRLGALYRRHPDVVVEIAGSTRAASLSRREADLAVRLMAPTDSGLVARRLGVLGYGLFATPEIAAAPPAGWRFLGYDDDLAHVPQQRWLVEIAADRPMVLRCNDLVALHAACVAGLGVAALPHFMAKGDSRLRSIPIAPKPVPREIWLLVHPDLRRSPRVRAVMDAVIEMFDDARTLLG